MLLIRRQGCGRKILCQLATLGMELDASPKLQNADMNWMITFEQISDMNWTITFEQISDINWVITFEQISKYQQG